MLHVLQSAGARRALVAALSSPRLQGSKARFLLLCREPGGCPGAAPQQVVVLLRQGSTTEDVLQVNAALQRPACGAWLGSQVQPLSSALLACQWQGTQPARTRGCTHNLATEAPGLFAPNLPCRPTVRRGW